MYRLSLIVRCPSFVVRCSSSSSSPSSSSLYLFRWGRSLGRRQVVVASVGVTTVFVVQQRTWTCAMEVDMANEFLRVDRIVGELVPEQTECNFAWCT